MGIEGACGYFLVIALLNNQQQHSVCMYIVQPRGNVIDFDIFQHKRDRNTLLVDRVMFLWN